MNDLAKGRVEGKVAFVTGAGNGIGAACARMLAAHGASVVVSDINRESCEQQAAAICREGGTAISVALDTTDEAGWTEAMGIVMARYGRLDIAVNCAGVSGPHRYPSETTLEEWRAIMNVNLDGVFLGCKHALAAIEASTPVNGSIINISSVLGIVGHAGVAAYNASKGGVRLLSKSIALSCAQKKVDVRVNSVHPGFIDTPLVRRSMARFDDPAAAQAHYDGLQPVGRLGSPEDVAWGVLYLASDESRFVTGSELVIDGGYTAR